MSDTTGLIPETLRNRIRRRQCVAFVGAGFSRECGMPDWGGLLAGLLEDARMAGTSPDQAGLLAACEQAVADRSVLTAASLLRDLLTPADADEAIRRRFGMHVLHSAAPERRGRMNLRREFLVKAPWAGILTTNYDELIERAIDEWCTSEVVRATGEDPRLGLILSSAPPGGFFFVKVHGSVSGSRFVLGTEEYDRTYLANPQMSTFLYALMLRYHIVFIGCSLEDEILRIRRKLCQDFLRLIPTSYALLPADRWNLSRRAWLRHQAQIECLLYDSGPEGNNHSRLDDFLREVAGYADDPNLGKSFLSVSQRDLLNKGHEERLRSVGDVNEQLLRLIADQPDRAISHDDLVNLTPVSDTELRPALAEMSPSERVYRAYFLRTIRLLDDESEAGLSHRYRVPDETIAVLRRRDRPVQSLAGPEMPG